MCEPLAVVETQISACSSSTAADGRLFRFVAQTDAITPITLTLNWGHLASPGPDARGEGVPAAA